MNANSKKSRSHGVRLLRNFALIFSLFSQSCVRADNNAANSNTTTSWGLYEMLTRRNEWGRQIDQEVSAIGGKPQFILFFRDIAAHRGFPTGPVELAVQRGLTPIISLEPIHWGSRHDNHLAKIANGDFDDYFRRWATDAKQWGGDIYLRFGFEMNGDWFSWGEQPDLFKKTWIHLHGIFSEVGCSNVKWMFSPNVLWQNMTVGEGIAAYYPGSEYVDSIGIDGYNFGDHHDQWHKWESYSTIFERTIAACVAAEKPIFISEIGCADDPRKAEWIRDFLEKVSADKRIEGFVYFNHFNPRKGEPNWRLDSDPASLKAFQDWARRN